MQVARCPCGPLVTIAANANGLFSLGVGDGLQTSVHEVRRGCALQADRQASQMLPQNTLLVQAAKGEAMRKCGHTGAHTAAPMALTGLLVGGGGL